MREALLFLQDVDLSSHAHLIGELIKNADQWLLGIVVVFLVCLGHKIAIGHRVVYGWGLRLAALTALSYGGYLAVQIGDLNEAMTPAVGCRIAIVAGAVLAASWIVLPFVLFVYANFRFGLVGFVGYCGFILVNGEFVGTEALPGVAARGLLVAGLAMVLAWILRPIWEFIAAHWPAQPPPPTAAVESVVAPTPVIPTAKHADDSSRPSRAERRRRLLARMQSARTESTEPLTPAEIDARRRRSKARLDAELAYVLATPQFTDQVPRELFDRWLTHYLGEHLTAEEVEENSRYLQKILREQGQGGNTCFSLEELDFWFAKERQRYEALDLEPQDRQAKLTALQDLYYSLAQRFRTEPPLAIVPMHASRQHELLAERFPLAEAAGAGN